MRPGRARFRSLALAAVAGLLAAAAVAAPRGPREHARGVWGQDELLRSIRQLENDWDRLDEAWADAEAGLNPKLGDPAPVREEIASIGGALDELRDGYERRAQSETLALVEALLPREEPLFRDLAALDPPKPLRHAWEQVSIDLRRLAHEAQAAREGRPSRLGMTLDPNPLRIAIADIEDLSDELKRYLLRTEAEEAGAEPLVRKRGGPARHLVHDARLERAVLEFEEAADELKTLHRQEEEPTGLGPLVDRLARSARTIDFSMGEASVPEEAQREWREIVPRLEMILEALGPRGIGAGWETHR